MIDVLNYPPPNWSRKPSRKDGKRASKLNEQGRAEMASGDLVAAEKRFMQSIEVVPPMGMPRFNSASLQMPEPVALDGLQARRRARGARGG